ncbi:TPA: hypothetical protein LVL54_002345 [Klebsiella michiganensis]|uniref:hypothetical protein n=1 Tax=Klebsiella michiganensis TaxID=1134687 RepID=UPI00111B35C3|nr:hypothetical protein [Klebsiella michiganensis]HBM2968168.1 hypothetical protein [Klebsiella michiganensis]
MNINSFTLERHFAHSIAAEHLFNLARDLRFLEMGEEESKRYQEKTLNALKIAKVEDLSDLDAFISENLEKIQSYLADLRKHNPEKWAASNYFLYELIVLLKYPSIFTKEYQDENEWADTVAGNVERALRIHSPEMTQ